MRVVQILPGPIPTFTASAPALIRSCVACGVTTLPTTISMVSLDLIFSKVLRTLIECPCAESSTSTSAPASASACALSNCFTPIAAPTFNRPKLSLQELGYSIRF